jgi:hypothetical protein
MTAGEPAGSTSASTRGGGLAPVTGYVIPTTVLLVVM